MIFGYIRVSKSDQNYDLQKDSLLKYGCDAIFEEKVSAVKKRTEFEKLFSTLRKGDTIVVWRTDRLGRTAWEMIKLMVDLSDMGVNFVSTTEGIDTSTTMGKLWFQLNAVLAENERTVLIERTRAGLEAARLRNRIGGRKAGLSPSAIKTAKAAKELYMKEDNKMSSQEIADVLNISKSTLYRYLKFEKVVVNKYKYEPKKSK